MVWNYHDDDGEKSEEMFSVTLENIRQKKYPLRITALMRSIAIL
jgi:hypothetical protein